MQCVQSAKLSRKINILLRCFLENALPELLKHVPLNQRLHLYFMQDVRNAHLTLNPRKHLNSTFTEFSLHNNYEQAKVLPQRIEYGRRMIQLMLQGCYKGNM